MKRFLTAATLAVATLSAGSAMATQVWVEPGVKLNARTGPGTQYHVLGTFDACTPVHMVAYHHGWAKVVYGNHFYWVSAKYLQKSDCYQPRVYKKHPHHQHSHKYRY
ncbi:SH3 domain-containing protein [Mesobacterium sp. TK19101]|uniref:SH3 domain-containing protein n=1 Tax=Mesobacterium hydrothermale TaxID=3111907 RepID=A0ABU6HEE9_9RHOB|nr:SH3 domain-containing protein [Mesobacterium sp. TK19101]MEC3860487.1 SH3 domain-containing protein [Mesobacterium sp. TK19101]